MDLWPKKIAPSNDLRKCFSHDPRKWEEFKKKYEIGLKEKQELLRTIKQAEKNNCAVTLLYSAKGREHNDAVALNIILETERQNQDCK